MGVVSTLQDVRKDLEPLAPADVLKEIDWCIDRICAWEADDQKSAHNYTQPAARDCWTCGHRRQIEIGPGLAAGIRVQTCREFVSFDPRGNKARNLPCGHAFDAFCGGASYRPDFWTRALKALRIT